MTKFRVSTTSVLLVLLFVFSPVFVQAITPQQSIEEKLPDKIFTVISQVWRTSPKDQGNTGTCWCFSTSSFIESEVMRMGNGQYSISQMFTVYNLYLEKARRYLRLRGNNVFDEGGLSHDLMFAVSMYGLVQESDYDGFTSNRTKHDHSELVAALRGFLDGLLTRRAGPSGNWEGAFRGILDAYLGPLPATTSVAGRELTPLEFAGDVLNISPEDYIEITSYSSMPFYSRGQLLVPDNWMRSSGYYNVPLDDFMNTMDHALENGFSIVVDLDVSERMYSNKQGYALLEGSAVSETVGQELREAMFDDRRTTDDHLMHTVGIARDKAGGKYYLTKNSYGTESRPYSGHIYLSENYVRAKVLAYMVHKDGIPEQLREKLGIK